MLIYFERNIDSLNLPLRGVQPKEGRGVRVYFLALIRFTVLLYRQKNQKLSAVIAFGHVIPRILHKTERSQVSMFYDPNSGYVLHAIPSPIQCRKL